MQKTVYKIGKNRRKDVGASNINGTRDDGNVPPTVNSPQLLNGTVDAVFSSGRWRAFSVHDINKPLLKEGRLSPQEVGGSLIRTTFSQHSHNSMGLHPTAFSSGCPLSRGDDGAAKCPSEEAVLQSHSV